MSSPGADRSSGFSWTTHALPDEILSVILTSEEHLGARDVANASRVCRAWRSALPRHASARFLVGLLEHPEPSQRKKAAKWFGGAVTRTVQVDIRSTPCRKRLSFNSLKIYFLSSHRGSK